MQENTGLEIHNIYELCTEHAVQGEGNFQMFGQICRKIICNYRRGGYHDIDAIYNDIQVQSHSLSACIFNVSIKTVVKRRRRTLNSNFRYQTQYNKAYKCYAALYC